MRPVRALLLALLILLVGGAGLAVFAIPSLTDWESRRGQVARLASERLGRPVVLAGDLNFTFLPQPVLEATEVLIGEGGDGLGLSTRALRLRLDLSSLLIGRLAVREAALVGAEIRLPWPPQSLAWLAPPPWLTGLDARLEQGRLLIGDVVLEGVQARFLAGGPAEALSAEGVFQWGGRETRFSATLGRPGEDGAAPLDLSLSVAGTTLAARGILPDSGGFEGRLDATGSNLAALLPSPPGPFRAQARFSATPELLAASGLSLELGGQAMTGAAALRLAPAPRLEMTLAASRLDLAPWLDALRETGSAALPVALDLAAEAATLGPLRLRRLRGTAHLEGERLTLSDISAELPGEARIEATGASAGPRLDFALRFAAAEPRALLESLGWPAPLPLPPGAAEGQMRLSAEGPLIAASDLAMRVGTARMQGGFTWRRLARPALAVGLEVDEFTLPVAAPALLRAVQEGAGAADLQLRFAAERIRLEDGDWEKAALDAAAEGGRWAVRRLAARHQGVDLALSGVVAGGRVGEAVLEATGPAGPGLALIGLARPALADAPMRLRAQLSGPFDALAGRAELDVADARVEVQGTLDWNTRRGTGGLTVRHPGAGRFLHAALGGNPPRFLGEGSFSLIANWQARPDAVSTDGFELVAGGLRGRGQLALALGERPSLSGRLHLDTLPLPEWGTLLPGEWPALDLALRADQATLPGLPPLTGLSAALRGDADSLRLEEGRATLAGGALSGGLRWRRGDRPALETEGKLEEALLAGPVFGTPFDVVAGRVSAEWRLAAAGHSPAALIESLDGPARIALRDAVVQGFDANAAAAALGWTDTPRAEAALRAAMAGGTTTLDRAEVTLGFGRGVGRVETGELLAEGGLALRLSGRLDLSRDVVDLRLAWPGEAEVALRATGPAAAPLRLFELGAWLRRRAEAAP
ncbi:AsmA family protein [Sabulicella glaciei]|uniref:AsmA-like C-terminal region-containing protein n=1 Tax=Sabulicella glaciei TaxID=2984948 RepID=A0ABT3NXR1_9PROT|nr:AsmA-like C-terminal region-containing protein [Roseococcus sp. MDT2-1-1]MCW8086955.1 AsmA-like C-terminal region-containing protein [Roseococcus sp. MDT2-1-1]